MEREIKDKIEEKPNVYQIYIPTWNLETRPNMSKSRQNVDQKVQKVQNARQI